MALGEKPDLIRVLAHYATQAGKDFDEGSIRSAGQTKIRCPFHDDHNPSAVVNMTTERFRCFACDAPSGDSVDVIEGREGIGFSDAIKWAEDHLGFEGGEVQRAPAKQDHRPYRPSWLHDEDD
jgi:DNA primase